MPRHVLSLAALALAIFGSAFAARADDATDRLIMQSAATEWVFDNCDNEKLDAGFLLASQVVLSRAGPAAISAGALTAKGIEDRYPDKAAACADMEWVALPE